MTFSGLIQWRFVPGSFVTSALKRMLVIGYFEGVCYKKRFNKICHKLKKNDIEQYDLPCSADLSGRFLLNVQNVYSEGRTRKVENFLARFFFTHTL